MHAGGDLPSIGVGTLACSIRIRGGFGAKVATEDGSRFRGDMLGRIAACHAHRRNAPRVLLGETQIRCAAFID
jgi:hypothetical protein